MFRKFRQRKEEKKRQQLREQAQQAALTPGAKGGSKARSSPSAAAASGSTAAAPSSNTAAFEALRKKQPITWNSDNVSTWINGIGLGEHAQVFKENDVGGGELFGLTRDDLQEMGIAKIGHRKRILSKIRALAGSKGGAFDDDDASMDSSYDTSESMSSSSSVQSKTNSIAVKVEFDGAARVVYMKKKYDAGQVHRRLEGSFGFPVEVYVPLGNDRLLLTDAQWNEVKEHSPNPRFIVERRSPNKVTPAEAMVMNGLLDSTLVIDTKGTIIFVNDAVTAILGYTPDDLVGRNVITVVGEEEHRVNHDQYLRNYLTTGKAKILGSGREVRVRKKDNSLITAWLSVVEQKKGDGRHTFLGTLHEVDSRDGAASRFQMYDAIQRAVAVIDPSGVLQFVNSACERLLGYGEGGLMGSKVNLIMPEPYASKHDQYLSNFLRSGRSQVIGTGGRSLVAKKDDGSLLPITLEVSELVLDAKRYFVGMLTERSEDDEAASTLEQARSIVENLGLPSIITDTKGRIQAFNEAAETLLGYAFVDVVGKNVKIIMNKGDAAKHDGYLKNFLLTGEAKIIGSQRKVVSRLKSGTLKPVNLTVTMYGDSEQDALFIGVLWDPTQS